MKNPAELFEAQSLQRLWDSAPAENEPLPSGTYRMAAIKGEPFTSKQGTPGYKVTWAVCDGEHESRRVWMDCWLTANSIPRSKRLLAPLGLNGASLSKPLSAGITADVTIAQRQSDEGREFNEVKAVTNILVEVDPFSPDVVEETAIEETAIETTAVEETAVEASQVEETAVEASQHIIDVASAIPPGIPKTLGELAKATGINATFIGEAIEVLKQHGLTQTQVAGTHVYSWAAQPELVSTGVDTRTIEVSDEEIEAFFGEGE